MAVERRMLAACLLLLQGWRTAASIDHPARAQVGRWTAQPALPPLPSFSDGPFAAAGC
jgi:hypothetical protein